MRTQWSIYSPAVILIEIMAVISQALETHSKGQVGNLMSRGKKIRILEHVI